MEERITREELLERLFHDDYENLKGKKLRLTRVRVPGKSLDFAHVFTPSDGSVYENLALHIGVHEGEDHRGETIGIMRVTPWEAIVVATDVAVKAAHVEVGYGSFQRSADHNRRVLSGNDSSRRSCEIFPRRTTF